MSGSWSGYFDGDHFAQQGQDPDRIQEWIESTDCGYPTNTLHILCLGDSLTSGCTREGSHAYPYSDFFLEEMQESLPKYRIYVDVDGFPGDRVGGDKGQYLKRLEQKLEAIPIMDNAPYDWIITLGGTNDLFAGRLSRDIYFDLREST